MSLKMLIFTVVLLMPIADALGNESCEMTAAQFCEDYAVLSIPDSSEDLRETCPKLISRVECIEKHDTSCETKGEEKAFKVPGQYESILQLLNDLCDENTLLHIVAFEKYECAKDALLNSSVSCWGESSDILSEYDRQFPVHTLGTVDHLRKSRCMRELVEVSCLVTAVSRECGSLAKDAFYEILRRSYFYRQVCDEVFLSLLEQEVELLEIGEQPKDYLRETFRRISWA